MELSLDLSSAIFVPGSSRGEGAKKHSGGWSIESSLARPNLGEMSDGKGGKPSASNRLTITHCDNKNGVHSGAKAGGGLRRRQCSGKGSNGSQKTRLSLSGMNMSRTHQQAVAPLRQMTGEESGEHGLGHLNAQRWVFSPSVCKASDRVRLIGIQGAYGLGQLRQILLRGSRLVQEGIKPNQADALRGEDQFVRAHVAVNEPFAVQAL